MSGAQAKIESRGASHTRVLVVPFLVAAGLYAAVGPSWAISAALGVVVLAGQLSDERARFSKPVEWLLSLLLLGATIAVLANAFPVPRSSMTQLRTGWSSWAGATLTLVAARCWVARPVGGTTLSLAILLTSLTASGGVRSSLFLPFAAVFVTAAFVARRAGDDGSAPIGKLSRRHGIALATVALMTGLGTWVGSMLLPQAHTWALQRIIQRFEPRSGFTQRLSLGSMHGMLISDDKVLRVRGPAIDHLRGVVYDFYEDGRWHTPPTTMRTVELPDERPAGEGVVELEIVESEPERYFVPLQGGNVAVSSGVARTDKHGIYAPLASEPADRLWFRPGAGHTRDLARPKRDNIWLDRRLRSVLTPIALEWTQGIDDPQNRLIAIKERLERDYRYSLDVEDSGRTDPVVSFLTEGKQGHCEYFATAMALLGRSLMIPTRVVGGYNVTEWNELGGYAIVRERNAHAWVEAWLPEQGWVTFDPTPAGPVATSDTTPLVAALLDLAATRWAAFLSWLDRRTWTEMIAPPILLVLLGVLVRWWRVRRSKGARARRADGDRPLPAFEWLSSALSARGVLRRPSETLERLAARLDRDPHGLARELADTASLLLRRYAALRYGGRTDARLDEDVRRFCADLGM